MTRVYPCYEIDLAEAGFVHIVYEENLGWLNGAQRYHILRNDLWFERQNLPWVVTAIQDCISVDRMQQVYLTRGEDRLQVREWGSEHEPEVCIINERSPEVAHPAGPGQACCMKFPLAAKLLVDLDALVTWDAEAYAISNAPVPLEFAEAAKAAQASWGPGHDVPSAWYQRAAVGYAFVMEARETPANHPRAFRTRDSDHVAWKLRLSGPAFPASASAFRTRDSDLVGIAISSLETETLDTETVCVSSG